MDQPNDHNNGPDHGQQFNENDEVPCCVLIPDKSAHYEKRMNTAMTLILFLVLLFTMSKVIPDALCWLNIMVIHKHPPPALLSEYIWSLNLAIIPLPFNSMTLKNCQDMYLYITLSFLMSTLPLFHIIIYYFRDVWHCINGMVFVDKSAVVWWDEYPYGMYIYYFMMPAIILQTLAQVYGWKLTRCWELATALEEITNTRGPRRGRGIALADINPLLPIMQEILVYDGTQTDHVFRGRGRRGNATHRGRGAGRARGAGRGRGIGQGRGAMLPVMERRDDMFLLRGRTHLNPERGDGQAFPVRLNNNNHLFHGIRRVIF